MVEEEDAKREYLCYVHGLLLTSLHVCIPHGLCELILSFLCASRSNSSDLRCPASHAFLPHHMDHAFLSHWVCMDAFFQVDSSAMERDEEVLNEASRCSGGDAAAVESVAQHFGGAYVVPVRPDSTRGCHPLCTDVTALKVRV